MKKGIKQLLWTTLLFLTANNANLYADPYDIVYGSFKSSTNAQIRLEEVTSALSNEEVVRIYHNRTNGFFQVIGDYNLPSRSADNLANEQHNTLNRFGISDKPFVRESEYNRPASDYTINYDTKLNYDINYGIFTKRENAYTFRAEVATALKNPYGIKIHFDENRNQYYVYGNYDFRKTIAEIVADEHFSILKNANIVENSNTNKPRPIYNINGNNIIELPGNSSTSNDNSNLNSEDLTVTIGTGENEYPNLYRLIVNGLSVDSIEEINKYIALIRDYNPNINDIADIKNHTEIKIPASIARSANIDQSTIYEGMSYDNYDANHNLFSGARPNLDMTYLRNTGPSREGESIDKIILHTTEHKIGVTDTNNASYISRYSNAHFLIGKRGEIYQILPTKYMAYGAGDSLWNGEWDIDPTSINIEIHSRNYNKSGGQLLPASQAERINNSQYESIGKLVSFLQKLYPSVSDQNVLTHYQIAINDLTKSRGRKGDPPQYFDWSKIGLSNNWLIIDPDIQAGRARAPNSGEGYAPTPGMLNAR